MKPSKGSNGLIDLFYNLKIPRDGGQLHSDNFVLFRVLIKQKPDWKTGKEGCNVAFFACFSIYHSEIELNFQINKILLKMFQSSKHKLVYLAGYYCMKGKQNKTNSEQNYANSVAVLQQVCSWWAHIKIFFIEGVDFLGNAPTCHENSQLVLVS